LTTTPRRPSSAARAVRRSRRPGPRSTTFVERNRTRLLWAGGILAFLALAFVGLVLPSITPAYDCANQFNPTPEPSFVAPSAAPVASGATPNPQVTPPPPGFVEPDMGHLHVPVGERVRYTYCPPASGRHYSAAGQGPVRGGLYAPGDATIPQGWIHNLEHGAIVLLYKCEPGNACTDEGQAELKALLARWPTSPICKIPPGQLTPVIARFDDMPYPYAALVWDLVLPMQTIDEEVLFEFYAEQAERFNPEPQCAQPTPTPGPPTPTPAATGTPVPSTVPSGSAPAATQAPAASASPAASAAPAAS
jgi:hypothetical protein